MGLRILELSNLVAWISYRQSGCVMLGVRFGDKSRLYATWRFVAVCGHWHWRGRGSSGPTGFATNASSQVRAPEYEDCRAQEAIHSAGCDRLLGHAPGQKRCASLSGNQEKMSMADARRILYNQTEAVRHNQATAVANMRWRCIITISSTDKRQF